MNNRKSYLLTFFLISSGFICTPLLGMDKKRNNRNKTQNGLVPTPTINTTSRDIENQLKKSITNTNYWKNRFLNVEQKKNSNETIYWKDRALKAEELSNKYFDSRIPLQNSTWSLERELDNKNKTINNLTNNNYNLQKATIDLNKQIKATIDLNKQIINGNMQLIARNKEIFLPQQMHSNQYPNIPQQQPRSFQQNWTHNQGYLLTTKNYRPLIRRIRKTNRKKDSIST